MAAAGPHRAAGYHAWPTYDEAKCVEQTIEIAVQVNGKVKARIKVPAAIENADAIAAAKAEPAVAEAIAGKTLPRRSMSRASWSISRSKAKIL